MFLLIAGWRIIILVDSQNINQSFCKFRNDTFNFKTSTLSSHEDVSSFILINDPYKKKVEGKVADLIQMKFRMWNNFRSKLNGNNQLILDQILKKSQITKCEQVYDHQFKDFVPLLFLTSLPKKFSIDKNEASIWETEFVKLKSMIVEIKNQLNLDAKILCASSLALKRSENLERMYILSCKLCNNIKYADEVHALYEKNKILLKKNAEIFKIKWSENEEKKLDCLKDFKNDKKMASREIYF